jgi:GT2 family glycosyltransferase
VQSSPEVSVLVVAFRQREPLLESLEAIERAAREVPGGAEVIVVDNGGLAGLVGERFPSVRVLLSEANVGFAAAVNRGIATAGGSWVALVNDDAKIERDALARALVAGNRDPRVGSVACQVRFRSAPGTINSAGITVNRIGVAAERFAGRPIAVAQEVEEVFGASGCFALYRKSMLNEIGGLESQFFAYLEDVDLAWRARAAGWGAVYEPGAVALHHASASSGEGSQIKYRLSGRNRGWLLATTRQLAAGLLGIVAYDTAYVLYAAARDHTLAPLRGRLAGLRRWRTVRHARQIARVDVALDPIWLGIVQALRMHRAYRDLGAGSAGSDAAG